MHSLNVELAERSYTIHLGSQIFAQPELILPHLSGKQVCIVTNTVVGKLYLEQLEHNLRQADPSLKILSYQLPDGEAYKTLAELEKVWQLLLENRFSRNATLIALGGGVVGDMTGFAAACYQRGINFIQIPTTLLSQVDSSVGGKTGVNHPLGKNMLGAFWQPRLVLADTQVLTTLSPREFSAGMAEVIKYGLLGDAEFLTWLEQNMAGLMAQNETLLQEAITRSCQNKAQIVAADERESGARALLNLGHTFGHAIETQMGYGQWLHGEAVAVGMWLAADLSRRLGWLTSAEVERVAQLLIAANLPIHPPKEMTVTSFLDAMAVDKKNLDGQLRLILLRKLGQAELVDFKQLNILEETLTQALKLS